MKVLKECKWNLVLKMETRSCWADFNFSHIVGIYLLLYLKFESKCLVFLQRWTTQCGYTDVLKISTFLLRVPFSRRGLCGFVKHFFITEVCYRRVWPVWRDTRYAKRNQGTLKVTLERWGSQSRQIGTVVSEELAVSIYRTVSCLPRYVKYFLEDRKFDL